MSELENILFYNALDELLADCEALKAPQVIIQGIVTVLENPVKLLCWVGDVDPAFGTARCSPGLYSSDLLIKLMQAVRALNWEVVSVILEQAISPQNQALTADHPL